MLRRQRSQVQLLDPSFTAQNRFIRDPARLKAALCTRRAGKSYGAGLYLFQEALANPGTSIGYIALTRTSAKNIMFKDVLKVINRKFKLGAKFTAGEQLTVTLPNGAVIYLAGADAKPDEMEKFLGQKYKLIVIDESGSFKQDVKKLVYEVLGPAMTDLDGTIVMIGTPRNNTKTFFYDVTTGKEPGWSVHKWSAKENPHIAAKFVREMETLIARNPRIVDTPLFKQMYLGEWAVDEDALVYKFREDRNTVVALPTLKGKATWKYILATDLGFNDATAFVLMCYNEHDPNLYIIDAYKKSGLDITGTANQIKAFTRKWPISKYIVDGANKQAVEEMKNRHQIPLIAAEKTGKVDFIEIMNSDFISGRIKVLVSLTVSSDGKDDTIADEWKTLVWDDKTTKRQENPACPNHLSDAALYGWREAYNYMASQYEAPPDPTSEARVDEFWDQEAEKIAGSSVKPFWERDWDA